MKYSSTLSLLVLSVRLQGVTSAPIVPTDCSPISCHPSLLRLLSLGSPRQANLHLFYPSSEAEPEIVDSPPSTSLLSPSPDAPLASDEPTESSYFSSLAEAASSPTLQHSPIEEEKSDNEVEEEKSKPAEPTSTPTQDSTSDAAARYWASQHEEQPDNEVAGRAPRGSREFIESQGLFSSGNSPDFIVVGIVLLFLIVVIAYQSLERLGALSDCFGRESARRRGQIYLANDKTVSFFTEKALSVEADAASAHASTIV